VAGKLFNPEEFAKQDIIITDSAVVRVRKNGIREFLTSNPPESTGVALVPEGEVSATLEADLAGVSPRGLLQEALELTDEGEVKHVTILMKSKDGGVHWISTQPSAGETLLMMEQIRDCIVEEQFDTDMDEAGDEDDEGGRDEGELI
jgi:hypothetical protein